MTLLSKDEATAQRRLEALRSENAALKKALADAVRHIEIIAAAFSWYDAKDTPIPYDRINSAREAAQKCRHLL